MDYLNINLCRTQAVLLLWRIGLLLVLLLSSVSMTKAHQRTSQVFGQVVGLPTLGKHMGTQSSSQVP